MKTILEVYELAKKSKKTTDRIALVDKSDETEVFYKTFDENSTTGPTLADFERRVESVKTAIIWRLRNPQGTAFESIIKENHLEVERQIALIEKIAQETKEKLKQYEFKEYQVDELLEDNTKKNIAKLVKECKKEINLFVLNTATLINPQKVDKAFLEMLRRAENDYISTQKKRLDIVTTYQIPGMPDTRVSIQRTIGDALPCTERFGIDKTNPLSNWGEGSIGIESNGVYQEQLTFYRHSSPPAIFAETPFKREQFAALSIKSIMKEIVSQGVESGDGTERSPFEVDLSTLTLLTPGFSDLVIHEKEKETRQLVESYEALMLYHDQTIPIEIDGKTTYVKLNANVMNTGLNPVGAERSRLPKQGPVERAINAKGMVQWIENAAAYFKQPGYLPRMRTDTLVKRHQEIDRIQREMQTLKKQLRNIYETEDVSSDEYLQTKKEFHALLDKEHEIYQRIFDEYQAQIQSKRADIVAAINNTSIAADRKLPNQAFLEALLMYCDGKVDAPEFGVRYLLMNKYMGRSIEFYCKSGKDRTGRMQQLLESMLAFAQEKDHYPRYDAVNQEMNRDDKAIQNQMLPYIGEFSVSRTVADANIPGAKGLQLEYKDPTGMFTSDVNKTVSNVDQGPGLGKIAKGIYAKNKADPTPIVASVVVEKTKESTGLVDKDAFGFEISIQKKLAPPMTESPIDVENKIVGTTGKIVIQGIYLKDDEEVKLTKKIEDHSDLEIVFNQKETRLLSNPTDSKIKMEYWLESWLTRLRSREIGPITLSATTKEEANIAYAAFLCLKDIHPNRASLMIDSFKGATPDFPEKNDVKHYGADVKQYQDNLRLYYKTIDNNQSFKVRYLNMFKKESPEITAGMTLNKLIKS